MSTRDEHVRLFATYLNVVAAGCTVGVMVTLPLAGISSKSISSVDEITYELIFAALSVAFAGAAHVFLWIFG